MALDRDAGGCEGGRAASREAMRARFRRGAQEFPTSPLYQRLSAAVAEDDFLLSLVEGRRPGQDPPFLLFGAVHFLLLSGVDDRLSRYYASIDATALLPDAGAAAAFKAFCVTHEAELRPLIARNLVQTNVVNRAVALLYALWAVGQHTRGPVHLIDVGTSAGAHLAFDRYRYDIGNRSFGAAGSPVRLASQWRSADPVPDLDSRPDVISRVGIDLHPFDARDPAQQLWLRALVWPEDSEKAQTLAAALAMIAADPPRIVRGDATEIIPALRDSYPEGDTVVVFHAAVRMHLRPEAARAFDGAIDSLAARGPLFHVSLEPDTAAHHARVENPAGGLQMHGPFSADPVQLAEIEGHLSWIKPR